MHTAGVAFAPRKSHRDGCAKRNILAQVLNQSIVYLERHVELRRSRNNTRLFRTCNFLLLYVHRGRSNLRGANFMLSVSLGHYKD